jgi:enoyl-CoA hydratase/carnithine racemase
VTTGKDDVGRRGATPFHHNEPDDYLPPKTAADLWNPVIAAVNGSACAGAFYLLAEAEFIISAGRMTAVQATIQALWYAQEVGFQSGTRQTWRTR